MKTNIVIGCSMGVMFLCMFFSNTIQAQQYRMEFDVQSKKLGCCGHELQVWTQEDGKMHFRAPFTTANLSFSITLNEDPRNYSWVIAENTPLCNPFTACGFIGTATDIDFNSGGCWTTTKETVPIIFDQPYPLGGGLIITMRFAAPKMNVPTLLDGTKPDNICQDEIEIQTVAWENESYTWEVARKADGPWVRFASTFFQNSTTISKSILNEALNDGRNENTFQVRVKPFGSCLYDRTSDAALVVFGSSAPYSIVSSAISPACPSGGDGAIVINALKDSEGNDFQITGALRYTLISEDGGTVYNRQSGSLPVAFDQTPGGGNAAITPGNWQIIVEGVGGNCAGKTFYQRVDEPALLTISSVGVSQPILCFGGHGSISVQVTNEVPPFTYTITNNNGFTRVVTGQMSRDYTFSALPAGHYQVTVKGCGSPATNGNIVLAQPVNVVELLPLNATNVSCAGQVNGSIAATVSGGQSPYEIQLNGGEFQIIENNNNNFLFTGLAVGDYTVTVRDANSCLSTQQVTIGNNPEVKGRVLEGNLYHVSCADGNNGLVVITPSGGSGVYEYGLDGAEPFQALNVFDNLEAGTYTVSVRDKNAPACRWDSTVVITAPLPIVLENFAITDEVDCYGGANGQFTVTASGGAPQFGYTYTLLDVTDVSDIDTVHVITTSLPASFDFLHAARYRVIASDGNANCFALMNTVLTQPDQVMFNPVLTDYNGSNVSCAESSDGMVRLSTTGGVYPHTIRVSGWDDQIAEKNETISFSGFQAGDYLFTVTYKDGACQKDTLITLVAPQTLRTVLTPRLYGDGYHVSCKGKSDGVISIEADGGTMPYTYTMTPPGVPLEYRNVMEDSVGFEHLAAGTYSVSLRDINNCAVDDQVILVGPDELTVSRIDMPDIFGWQLACNGDRDARVTINTTGGSYPQVITLANENQLGVSDEPARGVEFTDLRAGSYSFHVVDEVGCSYNGNFELKEPAPLLFDDTQTLIQKPDCYGNRTGTLQLQAYGGVTIGTGYQYEITYPNLPPDLPFPYPQVQQLEGDLVLFDQLIAGTYNVSVSDPAGCTTSRTVVMETNFQVTVNQHTTSVTCKSDTDGSAQLSISGGQAPYSVMWMFQQSTLQEDHAVHENQLVGIQNLGEGFYDFIVRDATGCAFYNGNSNFQIEGPAQPLSLTAHVSSVTCNGAGNGTVILEATGGWQEGLYRYGVSLDNLSVHNSIYEDLTPGVYTYFVKDNKGCSDRFEVTISEPEELRSSISSVEMVSCHGKGDGSFAVAINGGTIPYQLSLDGGTSWKETDSFDLLKAATYTVQIRDANQCAAAETITITEPQILDAVVTSHQNTLCQEANGSVALAATGGTLPYSYTWENSNGDVIGDGLAQHNLFAGDYLFTLIDDHQCMVQLPVTIINTNDIAFDITAIQGVTCYGDADGKAQLSVSKIQAPYTIRWDNGETANSITNLTAGEHHVTLKDANNCEASKAFIISTPEPLAVEVVNAVSPTCYGDCNGLLEVSLSGGTGAYSMEWLENGLTSNILPGICAGGHYLSVKDENNCTLREVITLNGPDQVILGVEDTTYHICQGQTVEINLGDWMNHTWSSNAGFYSLAGAVSLSEAGHYKVTVMNDSGCEGQAEFDVVYSNALLNAEFLIPRETYVKDTVICVDLSSPQPDKLVWKYDDQNIVSLSAYGAYNELVFLQEGQYEITLVSHLGGCVDQQSKTIFVRAGQDKPEEGARMGYVETGIKALRVFPNPNDGQFSCEVILYDAGDIYLRLFDFNGKVLCEQRVNNRDQVVMDINIENQPVGIYWLVVEAHDAIKTFKVLLK